MLDVIISPDLVGFLTYLNLLALKWCPWYFLSLLNNSIH
jgi:hypothetical protein